MLKVHTQIFGNITIICLQGELVTSETTILRNAVHFVSNTSVVVLDFARVSRIDARGLGVLLDLREQTQSKGIEFRLINVTRLVQQVLEITCLNTVFEISSDGKSLPQESRSPGIAFVGTAAGAM
jgi:anti-anti-sigma factor